MRDELKSGSAPTSRLISSDKKSSLYPKYRSRKGDESFLTATIHQSHSVTDGVQVDINVTTENGESIHENKSTEKGWDEKGFGM
jgi:hypothetical protein